MTLSSYSSLYKDVVARNLRRQFDLMEECITLCSENKKFFDINMIKYLHAAASTFLVDFPGQYRKEETYITYSDHVPPPPDKIQDLMFDFIFELHERWQKINSLYDAIEVAAFALWRLNWIHPFEDANGRVSRAVCYIIIRVQVKKSLKGKRILPQIIAEKDKEYQLLLRKTDKSAQGNDVDLNYLSRFLLDAFIIELKEQ